MTRPKLSLIAAVCVLSSPFWADSRGGVTTAVYGLAPGSRIIEECLPCTGTPIARPVTGSFSLRQVESLVCCAYEISDLEFQSAGGEVTGRGACIYVTSEVGESTQRIDLELSIEDAGAVRVTSEPVAIEAPFPVIEITASEDGSRDPARRFILDLVAVPRGAESTPYVLVPGDLASGVGSFIEIDCPNCLLVDPVVPLSGTFSLARLTAGAGSSGVFAVQDLELQGVGRRRRDVAVVLPVDLRGSCSSGESS